MMDGVFKISRARCAHLNAYARWIIEKFPTPSLLGTLLSYLILSYIGLVKGQPEKDAQRAAKRFPGNEYRHLLHVACCMSHVACCNAMHHLHKQEVIWNRTEQNRTEQPLIKTA